MSKKRRRNSGHPASPQLLPTLLKLQAQTADAVRNLNTLASAADTVLHEWPSFADDIGLLSAFLAARWSSAYLAAHDLTPNGRTTRDAVHLLRRVRRRPVAIGPLVEPSAAEAVSKFWWKHIRLTPPDFGLQRLIESVTAAIGDPMFPNREQPPPALDAPTLAEFAATSFREYVFQLGLSPAEPIEPFRLSLDVKVATALRGSEQVQQAAAAVQIGEFARWVVQVIGDRRADLTIAIAELNIECASAEPLLADAKPLAFSPAPKRATPRRRSGTAGKKMQKRLAIVIKAEHPELTDSEVAAKAGVSRETLLRDDDYKELKKSQKADGMACRRRGFRKDDGSFEAIA